MAMRGRGRAGSSRPSPYGGGGYGGGYGGGGDDDGCAVYVGNLPYDVTWKELKDHMSAKPRFLTRCTHSNTPLLR